jgi:hypothetical protein
VVNRNAKTAPPELVRHDLDGGRVDRVRLTRYEIEKTLWGTGRLADAAQAALLYALAETGGERYAKIAELY